jgi:site-specific recombinase XerD
MAENTANNERIKRQYFTFLKDAMRQSESTIDSVAKAIHRFETYTNHRDFKVFHFEQAVAFKRHLATQKALQSGKDLSKSTLHSTLTQLKRFFQWLATQPGFKSRLQYVDAEYFNLSEKEVRVATARRSQKVPTLEQIKFVIRSMPISTDIELRNRALISFTLLTGARDNAIASMKLRHVDLVERSVNQDARDVRTKFSKTFQTFFFPVGEEIPNIFSEWVIFLRDQKLWGNDDPLFPATRVSLGLTRQFEAQGLERHHWSNAAPIRTIFREAFTDAGLQYFNPHSFRNTLVRLGQEVCRTPEEFKAWSQNLGHEKALTTFLSYGEIESHRQGEIIQALSKPRSASLVNADELAEAFLRKLTERGCSNEAVSVTAIHL